MDAATALTRPPKSFHTPTHQLCWNEPLVTPHLAACHAPTHPVRNRLLRHTADSPDLLAVIKEEGRA